jgi:fumarylpyruvate hydrolase
LADLIWNVGEIIRELRNLFALKPGDLIFTGTPSGVGPVTRGDRMHGAIEGLGSLDVEVI